MPIVVINTNVRQADISAKALEDISVGAAEILGLETKVVQVVINAGCMIMFGGTTDPSAAAFVYSASGKLSPENNDGFAAKFTDLILAKIEVPKERFYLLLNNVSVTDACYMGSTIASLKK